MCKIFSFSTALLEMLSDHHHNWVIETGKALHLHFIDENTEVFSEGYVVHVHIVREKS
jgi:hypothetical protein